MPIKPDLLRNPRFRFREREIAIIHDCWKDGTSVLQTGIRRTGKSWVAKEALFRWAQHGTIGFLDVQEVTSLDDFYRLILAELPQTMQMRLSAILKSSTSIPSKLRDWVRDSFSAVKTDVGTFELRPPEELVRYWQPIVSAIATVVADTSRDELPVIGIDELPFMIQNLIDRKVPDEEIKVALASLRTLRDAGLSFIISGSVSMENLLTLHNIPHTVLGGLFRVSIPPFTQDEAQTYLHEQMSSLKHRDEAVSFLIQSLPDFVPQFLDIAVRYMRQTKTSKELDRVFHDDVIPNIRRAFLSQFSERLNSHYTAEEQDSAEQILDLLAKHPLEGSNLRGIQLEGNYRKVLSMLLYDNFLVEGSDFRYRFSLNLIRLWWQAERDIASKDVASND